MKTSAILVEPPKKVKDDTIGIGHNEALSNTNNGVEEKLQRYVDSCAAAITKIKSEAADRITEA